MCGFSLCQTEFSTRAFRLRYRLLHSPDDWLQYYHITTIITHPFDTRGHSETLMRRGQRLEGQARHDLQKGQNIVYLKFGKGGGGGGVATCLYSYKCYIPPPPHLTGFHVYLYDVVELLRAMIGFLHTILTQDLPQKKFCWNTGVGRSSDGHNLPEQNLSVVNTKILLLIFSDN